MSDGKVTGILYRIGPKGASNSFYYWRNFFDVSRVPIKTPRGSDLVKRYDEVSVEKLKEIAGEIDKYNTMRKAADIPESKLLEKIDGIIG